VAQPVSGLELEVEQIVDRVLARKFAPLVHVLEALGGSTDEPAGPRAGSPARLRTQRAGRPRVGVKGKWTPEVIKELRTSRGLTQKAFGGKVGVTPVAIYQWESGRSQPRPASARKLSRFANVGAEQAADVARADAKGKRGGARRKRPKSAKASAHKARSRATR
jgi:DNA-binding transcriptional regulator YiaG